MEHSHQQHEQHQVHEGPSTVPLATVGNGEVGSGNGTGMVSGEQGEGPVACNACKQGLDETLDNTVVSFGKYLFHRCAKCHNLVEHNTNLLLLSDGSPVCENCSYICSVCQKPIHNEAIVTGDESYHADCFRCRSCSNKIEELIFAKTNQGIWCMSCHNERVARTRKHAEAKRNRQAKKEGGSSSKSERERSGSGRSRDHREREKDREKTGEVPDVPSLPLSHSNSQDGSIRPLPPSPAPPFARDNTSFDGTGEPPHRRIQTSPGEAPRHAPPYPLPPSHSSQSVMSLATSPSGRPTTPLSLSAAAQHHSRTPSQLSDYNSGMSGGEGGREGGIRRTSTSHLRQEFGATSTNGGDHSRRPSRDSLPRTGTEGEQRDFQPYPLPESPRPTGPLSPTFSDGQLASVTSRNGSLSAPSGPPVIASGGGGEGDRRAANRRSGFYGLGQRPSISGEEGGSAGGRSASPTPTSATQQGQDATLPVVVPRSPSSETPPPPAPGPDQHSFLPDLHQSMSFYDPDTLLFLNHVGSAPPSPKLGSKAAAAASTNKALPELALNLAPGGGLGAGDALEDGDQAMERLSPSPGPIDISGGESGAESGGDGGDFGVPNGRTGEGDVARKVRESLHLARGAKARNSEGAGEPIPGALDVELVEMLLKELEETKREMKELRGKYNAFRRASRTAFEGFSMAREEYDKEVAARRDTERQMEQLRSKFIEQARRLAQVDQEQRTAENLKRQSKDLRNSVVGMEKHLSQLKAEVALSTAQIAELATLGKEDTKAADRYSVPSAVQDEVAEALNDRLEAIKDAHRDEVNALIAQRDDLLREVSDLKQTRDAYVEEANALSSQNLSLVEKNADATRQLDQLQESLTRMHLMSSKTAVSVNGRSGSGHGHTPSLASLPSPLPPNSSTSARSPLATARVIGSPTDVHSLNLNDSFRFAKPEAVSVEVQSRNKFKWGKGKSDTNKASQHLPPVPVGARSPVPPRAGSVDNTAGGSGVRQHAFQQTSILRPVRCDYCGDKMWGLNEVRCTGCGSYAHAKCAGYLLSGCHPGGQSSSPAADETLNFTPTGPPMFGNDLVSQAMTEGRDIPTVVAKCIEAVEAYGMAYEGIYRKTGGMGQTKLITQYFERGQDFDLQDRDKFNDIAAITSCMKNYFRSLPVPLFTHDLHEEFVAAAEMSNSEKRVKGIEQALYKLPPIHFHTARLLFQHLNRIKTLSVENKMTSANLGVVFGPTVLRSPIPAREWSDMGPKAKIVEILCDHAEPLFSHPYPPA
ncbi:hypothetical protein JCM11641_003608 [Rhodosporidiobolus odoratus]